MKLEGQKAALLGATAISASAWFVPAIAWVLRPIQYLNTHIHELCHALAASATGGQAEKILVHANGSGETPVLGGLMPIVASAGYVGAAAIGALLIAAGRDEKRARALLCTLAVLLGVSLLVWVRGDVVGLLWGLFWAVALGACAAFLRGRVAVFTVQFVGVQQCLNALLALSALLEISYATDVQSDATNMQSATGVPAMVWAIVWAAVGIALVIAALRHAWR